MLSTRWRKVLRDLWGNKTRTILVVLSIAVGVFAVGMISGAQVVISRDMTNAYLAVNPASATLAVDPFDDDLVQAVRDMPQVREAEGRRSIIVRVKTGPEEWKDLVLWAIPDYEEIRINKVKPESGAWPPPKRQMLIERSYVDFLQMKTGDTALIELPNGKQRELVVAGLAHDLNQNPAAVSSVGYGYVTFDTLEWLGTPRSYTDLNILVADQPLDKAYVEQVAREVREKVERSGRTVHYTYVPDPGKHPADSMFQAFLLLLGVLGTLCLMLSGFLVANTISAVLTQQVRQIGIMKAVGARGNQVTGMYLGMVLAFAVLSLIVGVPLGSLGALGVGSYLAALINFDLPSLNLPLHVFALEVGVGVLVPILAALYPIIAGTRITVREAMSDYGLAKGPKSGSRDSRLVDGVRGLSRPMLLSIRNTFRRKGRLSLTLATLVLGGAIFIGVFSVRDSAYLTLDDALNYFKFDVQVGFSRYYDAEQIEQEAMSVANVAKAESVAASTAYRLRADGTEGSTLSMLALTARTDLIQPSLMEGRWLLDDDENAVVLNTEVLRGEPDVKVGDSIVLKIGQRETEWQVVGIVRGVATGPIVYANLPYFSRVVRNVGRAGTLWVVTNQKDPASQAQTAAALEGHFEGIGTKVGSTQTTAMIRGLAASQFDIIVVFLLIMAVLLAIVGGLGLMGTMSLNVLERRREIGVMRAIGAGDGAVRRIFLVEGVLTGVLSWFIGALLSLPLSRLLSDGVGMAFLQAPLSFTFSISGAVLWFLVVIALSALASVLPARSASRVSVREVLAYE